MRFDTYGKEDFYKGMNIAICERDIANYTATDYKSSYNGKVTLREDEFIKGYLLGQHFGEGQPMIYAIEITETDRGKNIALCELYTSFQFYNKNNSADQSYYSKQSENFEITKAVYLFGMIHGIQINNTEITPETNPEIFTSGDLEWETFTDSYNRTEYAITKIPFDVYRRHNSV